MTNPIDFYFDLSSPYSYLAIQALPPVAQLHGRTVACHPVSLAALKRKIGNHGAALREIPTKHSYVLADCRRCAERLGVAFADAGSFEPDMLHRSVFYASDQGQTWPFLQLAARKLWGEGAERIDVKELMAQLALALSWEPAALASYVASEAALHRQAQVLESALAAGVFGVPTMVADGHLFWGQDRLPMFDAQLGQSTATAGALHASHLFSTSETRSLS